MQDAKLMNILRLGLAAIALGALAGCGGGKEGIALAIKFGQKHVRSAVETTHW